MHAVDRYVEWARPDLESNRPAAMARLYELIAASTPRGRLHSGAQVWRPPPSACPGANNRERQANRVRLVEEDGAFVTVYPGHDGARR